MPIYVYETVDSTEPVRRFEVQQSMKDAPLTNDPETGKAVRRVISGGYGYVGKGSTGPAPAAPRGGGCGSGCGCH